MVRGSQVHPEALPVTIRHALQHWPQLFESVQAVRSSFIYSLGTDLDTLTAPACDAMQALLVELRARFHERAASVRSLRCLGSTVAEVLHEQHWCSGRLDSSR